MQIMQSLVSRISFHICVAIFDLDGWFCVRGEVKIFRWSDIFRIFAPVSYVFKRGEVEVMWNVCLLRANLVIMSSYTYNFVFGNT